MVQGRPDASRTPEVASLGLHEGISDPRPGGCSRWPELLWLLSEHGEVVQGRCKATNLCRYCRALYVLETLEMLSLDAAENAPTLWAVLTAREHLTRRDTYSHLKQLRTAARRRWPAIEWFVQVEFQRRGALHLNLVIKGVPVGDRQELHELLGRVWCGRVDAEMPAAVWTGEVADGEGLMRYLQKTLAHGLKAEQAPPEGWRGHRTSQTRGYLVRPASVMRQEARQALRSKREVWKALERGLTGHEAELAAHEAVELAAATSWELWRQKAPTHELTERERQGRDINVPWFVLEAAFRWRDSHPDSDRFGSVTASTVSASPPSELSDSGGVVVTRGEVPETPRVGQSSSRADPRPLHLARRPDDRPEPGQAARSAPDRAPPCRPPPD